MKFKNKYNKNVLQLNKKDIICSLNTKLQKFITSLV